MPLTATLETIVGLAACCGAALASAAAVVHHELSLRAAGGGALGARRRRRGPDTLVGGGDNDERGPARALTRACSDSTARWALALKLLAGKLSIAADAFLPLSAQAAPSAALLVAGRCGFRLRHLDGRAETCEVVLVGGACAGAVVALCAGNLADGAHDLDDVLKRFSSPASLLLLSACALGLLSLGRAKACAPRGGRPRAAAAVAYAVLSAATAAAAAHALRKAITEVTSHAVLARDAADLKRVELWALALALSAVLCVKWSRAARAAEALGPKLFLPQLHAAVVALEALFGAVLFDELEALPRRRVVAFAAATAAVAGCLFALVYKAGGAWCRWCCGGDDAKAESRTKKAAVVEEEDESSAYYQRSSAMLDVEVAQHLIKRDLPAWAREDSLEEAAPETPPVVVATPVPSFPPAWLAGERDRAEL